MARPSRCGESELLNLSSPWCVLQRGFSSNHLQVREWEPRFGSRRWEMSVAKLVRSAARKALSLGLVTLLASAAWAQDAPPQTTQNAPAQNTQPSMPPLTPMPQAPSPQHNAHLYSDQNYAKPKSGFPNLIAPYTSRDVPRPNLTNSADDRQAVPQRQYLFVHQRCGGHGYREQPRHHLAAL